MHSVAGTRLFLELTNYPKIQTGELHIAHVLWGGLFLFIAAILPLIYANRWVYPLGAIFSGAGFGLFIDEVGKFITVSNDYHYPAAAPIIYVLFLLTVLVYHRTRNQSQTDPRIELYHTLDAMMEVLDRDLDDRERADLTLRLEAVAAQKTHLEFTQMALALLNFINRQDIYLIGGAPNFWQRQYKRVRSFYSHAVTEKGLRAILIANLGIFSLISIANTLQLLNARFVPEIQIDNQPTIYLFFGRIILEVLLVTMLMLSTILLLIGQVRRGIFYSYNSLVLLLTIVNVLVFFFDQFSSIIPATIQFLLLLLVIHYRRHFLPNGDNQ